MPTFLIFLNEYIQTKKETHVGLFIIVGVDGFEPPTLCL